MSFFQKLLGWLFGTGRDEDASLVGLTPEVFRAHAGDRISGAVRVAVIGALTGKPKAGVPVILTNLGGLRLENRTDEEFEVETDASGEVSVAISIDSGFGDLAVDTPEALNGPLLFQGRSEGVSDEIYIDFPSAVVAGNGNIEGRFHAADFLGQVILGGAFEACAVLDDETLVVVDPVEAGGGVYEFSMSFERAGTYLLSVIDLDNDARGTQSLCVSPSEARQIRTIGPVDPRAAQPYGNVTLRLRLEDEFGNAIAPGRMVATGDSGEMLALSLREGDEANLVVSRAVIAHVPVRIADSGSAIGTELEIPFAAAWLSNPGFVKRGCSYQTPVYLSPPADRKVYEASIRVDFDAQQTQFSSFSPGTEVVSSVASGADNLLIRISHEQGWTAEQYPDGIHIGTIDWSCIAQGETCFTLTAAMSPEEEPWTFCIEQKEALESCICINIIHPPWGKSRLKKVMKDAESLPDIISSDGPDGNLEKCCPVLSVEVEDTEIPRGAFKRMRKSRGRGGGGLSHIGANHDRDLGRLYDLVADYRKPNCINIVLFPMGDNSGLDGIMFKRGNKQGFGAIELRGWIKKRLTQHEIGHALGLTHVEDKKNLMWEGKSSTSRGVGVELTPGQCVTIFQNLSKFACE